MRTKAPLDLTTTLPLGLPACPVWRSVLTCLRALGTVADTSTDAHLLLAQFESIKGTILNTAPAEGPNSRAHELNADERALALALSKALADAILEEVAEPSRGTCWGAGI